MVKPLPSARHVVATVAVFFASLSLPLAAQIQFPQPIPQAAAENAALLLPDAPMPQTGPAAPPPATGQAAPPASSSSSSQTASPAAPATPQDAAAAAAAAKQAQHDQAERDLKVQEKQRLFGILDRLLRQGHKQSMKITRLWKLPGEADIEDVEIVPHVNEAGFTLNPRHNPSVF